LGLVTQIISHRGNLNGPSASRENAPDYIEEAMAAGFDVEVDLRMVGNQYFLGHDFPIHPVSFQWINERRKHLLLHVKDLNALKHVIPQWNFFCHSLDPYTVTSQGRIWLHDLSLTPDSRTIVPLITKRLMEAYPKVPVHAVCTDFVYVPRGTT
jgi:hypothetical protein